MSDQQMEMARVLELEQEERAAAASAISDRERDEHVMRAERLADQAWHLEEMGDGEYRPSGLWD